MNSWVFFLFFIGRQLTRVNREDVKKIKKYYISRRINQVKYGASKYVIKNIENSIETS